MDVAIRSLLEGLELRFAMCLLRCLFSGAMCAVEVILTDTEAEVLRGIVREECMMIDWDIYGSRWLLELYVSLYTKLSLSCSSDVRVIRINSDEAEELLNLVIPESEEDFIDRQHTVEVCVSICEKIKLALKRCDLRVWVIFVEYE